MKWKAFWDSFDSAVHKNEKLNAVEKFNYLQSKLTGDAANAISGLQLSNENYPIAVDILNKRFGNKQIIIDAHFSALMDLPPSPNQVPKL